MHLYVFVCQKCGNEFKQEGSIKHHYKGSVGERTVHGINEYKKCMKLICKANVARHRLSCPACKQVLTEVQPFPV